MWESKRSRFKKPDQDYYSISNKLKSEGKIDEKFEIMLSSLTLEEIIALRLELAAKAVNYKLYGTNIWQIKQIHFLDSRLSFSCVGQEVGKEIFIFLEVSPSIDIHTING